MKDRNNRLDVGSSCDGNLALPLSDRFYFQQGKFRLLLLLKFMDIRILKLFRFRIELTMPPFPFSKFTFQYYLDRHRLD